MPKHLRFAFEVSGKEVPQDMELPLVLPHPGMNILQFETPFAEDTALEERRENLKGRLLTLHKIHGVELEVCNITRSEIGLPAQDFYEGVTTVESGVVRITELQRQNYAYLKIE